MPNWLLLPAFLLSLSLVLAVPNTYLMHHTCVPILILVSTWRALRIVVTGYKVGGGKTRCNICDCKVHSGFLSSLHPNNRALTFSTPFNPAFIAIIAVAAITRRVPFKTGVLSRQRRANSSNLRANRVRAQPDARRPDCRRTWIIMKRFSRRDWPSDPINPTSAVATSRASLHHTVAVQTSISKY